jgi:hypothetical protein
MEARQYITVTAKIAEDRPRHRALRIRDLRGETAHLVVANIAEEARRSTAQHGAAPRRTPVTLQRETQTLHNITYIHTDHNHSAEKGNTPPAEEWR